MGSVEESWHRWIEDAHRVVTTWEERRNRSLLSVAEAAQLAEDIARAMQQACERCVGDEPH